VFSKHKKPDGQVDVALPPLKFLDLFLIGIIVIILLLTINYFIFTTRKYLTSNYNLIHF
jgi:hypothetical protein